MKEYPATYQEFKINEITSKMYKPTLALQARMEDENIDVSVREFVQGCTDLSDEQIQGVRNDQLQEIYKDIATFAYSVEDKSEGKGKKQSS